jgi:hypothetical protein
LPERLLVHHHGRSNSSPFSLRLGGKTPLGIPIRVHTIGVWTSRIFLMRSPASACFSRSSSYVQARDHSLGRVHPIEEGHWKVRLTRFYCCKYGVCLYNRW